MEVRTHSGLTVTRLELLIVRRLGEFLIAYFVLVVFLVSGKLVIEFNVSHYSVCSTFLVL